MSLCEAVKDGIYHIKQMNLNDVNGQKLEALGLTKGTELRVISRKKQGALVIEFCGKQIALCRNFASAIDVE